jgi:UDP-N-acetylmuramate dehydrogenase
MKKRFDSSDLNSNLSTGYLRRYSHIKICKNAGYLLAPKTVGELRENLVFATAKKLPIIPIGGASNILFGNCEKYVLIMEHFLPRMLNKKDASIVVSTNQNINTVMIKATEFGFGGLEFLAGIPAHLSGLIKMNAGAFGKEISMFLKRVKILSPQNEVLWLDETEIEWGYRKSSIQGFILAAELGLQKQKKSDTLKKMKETIAFRKEKQPLTVPNLGCFFKNPEKYSAGKLIDDCGLKGLQINDAQISDKHANFFVNKGNATFYDMIALINKVKKEVKEMFEVDLQLEIEVIHS